MPELENKRRGSRRVYTLDTLPVGAEHSQEQQFVADMTYQLQQVENATHHLVAAINRRTNAPLVEHNLVTAIASAYRLLHEHQQRKKRRSSIDSDIEEEY